MIQYVFKGEYENLPENFREMKGHYIADFEELSEEEKKNLKEQYPRGYFRLAFWEKGGSNFDDGQAQVVCGTEGEKLIPARIRNKGWLANDNHALFVGNELCVIEAVRVVKREVKLALKKYTLKPKTGVIIEEIVWEGTREDIVSIPETLKSFEDALKVSVEKVLEYRCLKPMYYEKKQQEE